MRIDAMTANANNTYIVPNAAVELSKKLSGMTKVFFFKSRKLFETLE